MSVAFDLAWIIAIVLVLVGIYALVAPRPVASHYGVAVDEHSGHGFVRATAVRDIAFGVALGAAAYLHSMPLLIVLAIVGIIVSATDLAIVSHHGHSKKMHPAHAIHASGIVAFVLIIAMALFAIGR